MVDVGEIKLRVNALRIHVQSDGHDIQITGTLTIAEKRALDTVCAGEHRQFCASDACTAVVMRMDRDDCRIAIGQMANKILNLVGIGVGRTHFNRVRQIENNRMLFCCAERFHNLMTDIDRKIHLRAGEGFRRVFIAEVCSGAIGLGQLTHQLGTGNRDVDDALHVFFEDDLALEG